MLVTEMVTRVQDRTRQVNTGKILGELQSAAAWAQVRLVNTADGLDMLVTFDAEHTFLADARSYDFSGLTGFFGIKQLWLKLAGDTVFTPMLYRDSTANEFVREDNTDAVIAEGHPVFYDVVNVTTVRFAPQLPAGAIIRTDYYRLGPILPSTEPAPSGSGDILTDGTDIPTLLHEAMVDKATAQCFDVLDDARAGGWEQRAASRLNDALYAIQRRSQGPTRTTPYRARRRRYI